MSRRPVYSIPDVAGQVKDPDLQRVLVPLINAWNVRNGQAGNGDEAFLTKKDLEDLLGKDQRIRGAVNSIANPPKPKPPGDVEEKIRIISKAIFNDPLWIYLGDKIKRIGGDVNGVEIRLTQEEEARTNDDTAIYSRIDKVVFGSTSPAYDANGYPIFQGPTGAIQLTMTGLANRDEAIAEKTETVEAGLQGLSDDYAEVSATLEEKSLVIAKNSQDIDQASTDIQNIYAQYTVKIDNQGYVSGFGLASGPAKVDGPCNAGLKPDDADFNNGICSRFYVRADVFAVGHPDPPIDPETGQAQSPVNPVVPFIIRNNKVYIDTAMIRDATIDTAKIGWLYANKIVGGLNKITPISYSNPGWTARKAHDLTTPVATFIISPEITKEELIAQGVPSTAADFTPSVTITAEVKTADGGNHEDAMYLQVGMKRVGGTGTESRSPVIAGFTKETGNATVTHMVDSRGSTPWEVNVYVATLHLDGVVTALTGTLMAIR